MARLCTADKVMKIDFSLSERGHWLIGRDASCDLCIPDDAVSRFHATLFRWHDNIYLLDHSLNGTYLCQDASPLHPQDTLPKKTGEAALSDTEVSLTPVASYAETALPAPSDLDDDINKSRLAFQLEQIDTRLPRIAGFQPHALRMRNDLQPQLRAIYGADTVANMAGLGRKLAGGQQLVIVGTERYRLFFEA